MELPPWLDLFERFGIYLGAVVYFVWRGERREQELVDKLDALAKFQREELVEINRESVAAMRDNTAAMDRNTAVMRQVLEHKHS